MTRAPAKTANDELAAETGRRLMRLLAMGALAGAGTRTALSVLRNANPTYNPPEVPKPLVVDMPYPVPPQAAAALKPRAIPLAGKEKKVASVLPSFLQDLPLGLSDSIEKTLPTFQQPTGRPGETDPDKVPLFGAGKLLAALGGLGGGYYGAGKVLNAADRWNARRELEDAKREYQEQVLGRLSQSGLPAKRAADAGPCDPDVAAVKAALDALFDAVRAPATKAAAEGDAPLDVSGPYAKTLMSMLFPGLVMGPDAAKVNMGVAAAAGLGGGYLGYNRFRDHENRQKLRTAVKNVDRANAEALPQPLVARLIPTPTGGY